MGLFSPREPGRALQVPPEIGGAEFNYQPIFYQPSAGTFQNAFFRVETDRSSSYPTLQPQMVPKMVFFIL